MTNTKTPKFTVGQVVVWERQDKKRAVPLKILEVMEDEGDFFYRVDRKNCLSEGMIRSLNNEELGQGGVPK